MIFLRNVNLDLHRSKIVRNCKTIKNSFKSESKKSKATRKYIFFLIFFWWGYSKAYPKKNININLLKNYTKILCFLTSKAIMPL